jgi:hypothetical protein
LGKQKGLGPLFLRRVSKERQIYQTGEVKKKKNYQPRGKTYDQFCQKKKNGKNL